MEFKSHKRQVVGFISYFFHYYYYIRGVGRHENNKRKIEINLVTVYKVCQYNITNIRRHLAGSVRKRQNDDL